MKITIGSILCAGVILPVLALSMAQGNRVQPVYVGARACGSCHSGESMGHQFSLWALTNHAKAYASLAIPESKRIAELSGINEEPQESAMCLGCHATAAQAEEWEREDTFFVEDGVQCELCHGPGSEYMAESVMKDKEAAMAAGLKMPDQQDCMLCHAVKGSHVAVLTSPKLDMNEAMERIAHPSPANARSNTPPTPPVRGDPDGSDPKYVGSMACAECHRGADMGFQFSRWRLGPHSRAFVILGTQAARDIAKRRGIQVDPKQSPDCLRCHTTGYGEPPDRFAPAFSQVEGVGCEACHGPGSEYLPEAIMRDPAAARQAGLKDITPETCAVCHREPFDFAEAVEKIAHPTGLPEVSEPEPYKTPLNLALSPDGKELYVACEASDSVIVVDTGTKRRVAEIPVGGRPADVTFRPDGKFAYASNRFDDTVSVIHVESREVLHTIPVGDGPHGLLTDPEGKHLFVLNTSADSISVISTDTLKQTKELSASRDPWSLALAPDGSRILVTHALSRFVEFRRPSVAEITAIESGRAVVDDRYTVMGANLLKGIDWHPSGEFAFATLNRTKNLVPMTRLLQGWTITNGLAVIWQDGRVDQVLLDEPHLSFPDPTDIAFTPNGDLALVTSSGSDRVAVVDVEKLVSMLQQATAQERQKVFPNHLGKPTQFVIGSIPTRESPRGILIAPDGKTAFVANSLDDSLTVIDVGELRAVGEIDLGGPEEISQTRLGERLFHSANITFQRQFSCHTCHPDGHIDGITYDIEPDGIGVNPVDNRTLRGILDTAPFKWEGTNPSLQRQCGPRLAVFFTRIQPFTPEELTALESYICTIPRPLNRYRPVGARYTAAQRRGKALFERTRTNDGRTIPEENRCVTCHPQPLFTDRARHDVGTRQLLDQESEFDTPHLNNIYDSAPYLHNGIAETLEEIWTRYNPYDLHGVTNDMTKDQLNDLIEYLKTL
jgi:YVTN family beta-propeller protein